MRCIRIRRTGSPISERPSGYANHPAGRHLAAGTVSSQRLGADASRAARCLRRRGRRCSTGAMTCSTRRRWDSCRMSRRRAARRSRGSTRPCRERQRRTRLRHDALRRGQGRAGRVHENVLRRGSRMRRALPAGFRAPLDCRRDRRGRAGSDRRRRGVREVLPRSQPARVFASDEDHFLFGSTGTERGAGHSLLDLARAAAHLSRAPAAPGRVRGAGMSRAGRPGDAGRPLEGHHRLSSRGHQLRRSAIPPGGANSPAILRRSSRPGLRIRRACRNIVAS